MPQITNAQLNDTVNRIEQRAGKLESRMDANDSDIKDLKHVVNALLTSFNSAKVILGIIGAVVTPIITAIIVLIIQHIWK